MGLRCGSFLAPADPTGPFSQHQSEEPLTAGESGPLLDDSMSRPGSTTASNKSKAKEAASGDENASGSDFEYKSQVPEEYLRQSWKIFEAILDRKIDALRLDVFSNSTPLPPPALSVDAQERLTMSIVDTIKDELPLRGSISIGAGNANGVGGRAESPLSQALLNAIHETQDMLSQFTKQSEVSIESLTDMLRARPRPADDEGSAIGAQLARIEDAVLRAVQSGQSAQSASALDTDMLAKRVADEVKGRLESYG